MKVQPCVEWPNCECPRCDRVRLRLSGMGIPDTKDAAVKARNTPGTLRVIGKCHYCGGKATTRDHVIPRSKGGRGLHNNKVLACYSCNQKKGSMTYEEFVKWIEDNGVQRS